ncbi:MAG: 16S rRNA (adenine(1518)-N(6)/adenine(1519)-N(6))-dimethyltransferase RsmA, partial [Treponema sp.]|nr:16S rRNA (adenine(1518)-N(6)/adenine(1519)-N(6))-dimethyltransferase RsmA [Treponema sp.]
LSVRKQWGQNFLINPQVRTSLVDALDAETGQTVWEIGSGLGSMTALLLERKVKVMAFEIDPGLCSVLEYLFGAMDNFTLIRGDVLKTWKTAESAPYLLGNLPYTVAALLMGNLITEQCFFKRMLIMVQKEVALRMTALPGSKNYSSISVLCASAYTMKIIKTLKGSSFYPAPHVDSAALCFERRHDAALPPALFYSLVRALFTSRRKTIANNLQNFLSRSCTIKEGRKTPSIISAGERAAAALNSCGLSGRERAETVPLEVFFALARSLEKNGYEH